MPYNKFDPAIEVVKRRLVMGNPSAAYYEVFAPNRNRTITRINYDNSVLQAVNALPGPFARCEVQGNLWIGFANPNLAAAAWATSNGWAFLHLHTAGVAMFRVYIPADLRRMEDIIEVLSLTPGLTGFKIAGYMDANNRSDVLIAWVAGPVGVFHIANNISNDMLHGMRPPGSSIIMHGCLIGYSREIPGSSVGMEVIQDLMA
jgi:hypothetical protein